MDGVNFKESDLYSIGGLIVVVPMVVLGLSKLFGPWSPKLAHGIVFLTTFATGIAVKLTIKTAFPGFSWVGLVVGLLIAAIISAQAYDTGSHFIGTSGAPSAPAGPGGTQSPGESQNGGPP